MSFKNERYGLYVSTLKPAIEQVGLISCRIDEIIASGSIPDAIEKAIDNCKLLLADIGDGNLNVMHEIGRAQAKGKPLILICDNIRDHEVPFNIRHLHRILYDDDAPGRFLLQQKLISTFKRLLSETR